MTSELIKAAGNGDLQEVKRQLNGGIKVDAVENGFTALSRACERGKHAVVEYLLSVKAKVNYSKDDNGEELRTPLYCACRSNDVAMVEILLQNNADPNLCWPLQISVCQGNAQISELLIQKGASLNKTYISGANLLHTTCIYGYASTAEVLIQAGMDLNSKDELGYTPLHKAAHHRDITLMQLLLDRGADFTLKNKLKQTPLLLAIQDNRFQEGAQLLVRRGADVNEANEDGLTPMHLAKTVGMAAALEAVLSENEQFCGLK